MRPPLPLALTPAGAWAWLREVLTNNWVAKVSEAQFQMMCRVSEDFGYTPSSLAMLVVSGFDTNWGNVGGRTAAEAGVLAFPAWKARRSRREIRDLLLTRVPDAKEDELPDHPGDPNLLSIAIGLAADEDVFKALFPFRARADAPLRVTRLSDWQSVYLSSNWKSDWKELITEGWQGRYDYVAMMGLVAYHALLRRPAGSWFSEMKELGVFTGQGCFKAAERMKVLSDLIKFDNTGLDLELCECSGFVGFRVPPVPGFDVVKEAQLLAAGGNEHTLPPGWSWERVVTEALPCTPEAVEYVDFETYVKEWAWLTSGASSVGRVKGLWQDTAVEFKARKNLLPYVMTPDEVWKVVCEGQRKQRNSVIVKAELGKVRLAVASDLATYLTLSWLNYLLGHAYLQWPGSTLDEKATKMFARLELMLRSVRGRYGLPFDYKGFDHQPLTSELKTIACHLVLKARMNVPATALAEFDRVARDMLSSFDDSTLTVPQADITYPVTGGLMSGLRWTSVFGNAWNCCMTLVARQWATMLLGYDPQVDGWIRGDDSAIVTNTPAGAAAMRLGYQVTGVLAGDGKYGILPDALEFLRLYIGPNEVRGYAAREIGALLQRKPWSSAPWEELSTLTRLGDGLRALSLRLRGGGDNARRVVALLAFRWCDMHNVSRRLVALPKTSRGPGVLPDAGWRCSPLPPRVEKLPVAWELAPTAGSYVLSKLSPALEVTAKEAVDLAQMRLTAAALADDVPELARQARDEWKRALKEWRPVWTKISPLVMPYARPLGVGLARLGTTPGEYETALSNAGRPLRHPGLDEWRDAEEVARVRTGFRPFKWWEQRWPATAHAILDLQKRGLSRAEAFDYVGGEVTLPPLSVNPACAELISRVVYRGLGDLTRTRFSRCSFSSVVAAMSDDASGALARSRWHRTLAAW